MQVLSLSPGNQTFLRLDGTEQYGPGLGRLGSDSSRGAGAEVEASGAELPQASPHFNHLSSPVSSVGEADPVKLVHTKSTALGGGGG